MPCGHPLAARRIVVVDGRLVTDCWACAARAEEVSRIVGPRARARGRATWDNQGAGISGASPNIMCGVLSVADTSREDASRLEVSAP